MLKVSHLSRHYGSATALNGLDFRLETGQVMAVLGPSGCGKSTLLKLISGLEDPDAGEVCINGQLITSPSYSLPPEKRPINMVFQDYALWPHMKVRKIVGYGLANMSRQARHSRVDDLLALMQLMPYADRLPSELSGGQQQRVAIARALATDPEVLLFDEPLSNLDVQLRMTMRFELADLFQRLNKTVLYVTHDPLEACALADELLILRNGHLEQTGTIQSLFANPATTWVAGLAGYDSQLPARLHAPLDSNYWQVQVGDQRLVSRVGNSINPEPGKAVQLMLHSDAIRLCTPGEDERTDTNYMNGAVKQCLFEGHQWRLRLDLGGAELAILSRNAQQPGAKLQVAFSHQALLAFN